MLTSAGISATRYVDAFSIMSTLMFLYKVYMLELLILSNFFSLIGKSTLQSYKLTFTYTVSVSV